MHRRGAFRHFVVELREQHAELEIESFADAVMVPLGTLKDWLRAGADLPADESANGADGDAASTTETTPASAQEQVVLSCWETWQGSFGGFCKHVRDEQRIDFGRGLISDILFAHGKRKPRRRGGRSPDERALRGSFETFFGGAEWVGDGWSVPVTINDSRFDFNVELDVDAYSGGFVGLSIRDEEDSAAVTEALADGVATTGEAPLALLLDNKPSNHTDEVLAVLGDVTIPIRATLLARQNPTVRALLDDAFARLALLDPEQHLRAAIARYPLDVIVDGIAIFEAKGRVGTLPPGVDARYLLGIVRNLGDEREGIAIAEELLRARLDARDRLLAPLIHERDAARAEVPDPRARVLRFVDLALAAERRVDRLFWLLAVAGEVDTHAKGDPAPLVAAAARRVYTTHRLTCRERQEAVRVVVANVVPLS